MGADAIGANNVSGTESVGVSGARGVKADNAIKRKNYIYKAVNVRFSS